MAFFRRRPLCAFCLFFALVTTAGFFLTPGWRLFCVAAALAGAAAVTVLSFGRVVPPRAARTAAVLCLCAAFAVGEVSLVSAIRLDPPATLTECKDPFALEAVVNECVYSSSYESRFVITVRSVNGAACDRRAILVVPGSSVLEPGYLFASEAVVGTWDNSGTWREDLNALADGIKLKLEATDAGRIEILADQVRIPRFFWRCLNEKLAVRLEVVLGRDTGRLTSALLLGRRDLLDDRVVRDFGRAGVSHLLALSGLHVSILIGCLGWIPARLGCPKKIRLAFLLSAAVLYLLLTGVSSSALRCVIMLGLLYLSSFVMADHDSPTTLCTALALILLFSPTSALDLSLWLSFCATFAILAGSPVQRFLSTKLTVRGRGRFPFALSRVGCFIVQALFTSLCATLGVLPITWLAFGEISILAPVMTLALLPFIYLLLIGGAILLLLSLCGLSMTGPVLKGGTYVLRCVGEWALRMVGRVSLRRGSVISLRYGFVPWILIPLALCLIAGLVLRLRHRWWLGIPPLCAALAFCVALGVWHRCNGETIAMSVLREGNSETVLLTDDASAMILDVSDGNYRRFSGAVELAEKRGHTEIDVCMLTHYHRRHITGLQKLFDRVVVRELWVPVPRNEDEYFLLKSIADAAENAGVALYMYEDSVRLFGNSGITVIGPDFLERSVQPLHLMRLDIGGERVVYAGRSVLDGESPLAGEALALIPEADVLWLGSHGPVARGEVTVPLDEVRTLWISGEETLLTLSSESVGLLRNDAEVRMPDEDGTMTTHFKKE